MSAQGLIHKGDVLVQKSDFVRPAEGMQTGKMPGHWVLARLGKRVLRPGGMELTKRMLKALRINHTDDVVEFAPGMGITAALAIGLRPNSYTAVERDQAAAKIVSSYLTGERQRCVVGSATDTGLPEGSASVVYGEAMLTMQTEETKRAIVREANRLLKTGGRYAIHEMCLLSDSLEPDQRKETERVLTGVVHHGVRPLTITEWCALLRLEGFEVESIHQASMSLLEPGRLISDEGLVGALRFVWNVLRNSDARKRVREMRSVFRQHRKELGAVSVVAVKK
ncbi:MAG TPA: methyltransferase domain-containing protein [Pyrinomonadaceae bacterium]